MVTELGGRGKVYEMRPDAVVPDERPYTTRDLLQVSEEQSGQMVEGTVLAPDG